MSDAYTLFDESGTVTMGRYQDSGTLIVVCPFVWMCPCVQSGTISKFWTAPLSSKSVYSVVRPAFTDYHLTGRDPLKHAQI